MKILYLIDTIERGGAETLLINTVNELCRFPRVTIYVGTTIKGNGELVKQLDPSITYFHFPCAGMKFLSGANRINGFIKKNDITHVHAHLNNSIMVARFALTKSVRFFQTYHNLDFNPGSVYYSKWRVQLDKLTFKSRFVSIYVSNQVRDSVEQLRKHKSDFYVLNNFADRKFNAGYVFKSDLSLALICIGNLKAVKNFEMTIPVMQKLADYNISLDIYGDGPLKDSLDRQLKETGVHIELKGRREITPSILNKYDLFLMTSKNEGMPISLLEAISFGMPCVLPNHLPIMKEIAQEAALYFSISEPFSLVRAILEIYKNKNQLMDMSRVALERAKLYSAQKHISKLVKIYNN
jgi:glycosyltransferase involved in cell wall biosynthesis